MDLSFYWDAWQRLMSFIDCLESEEIIEPATRKIMQDDLMRLKTILFNYQDFIEKQGSKPSSIDNTGQPKNLFE